jgi:hypothetical protein
MEGGPDPEQQDRFAGRHPLHGGDEEGDRLELVRLDLVVVLGKVFLGHPVGIERGVGPEFRRM